MCASRPGRDVDDQACDRAQAAQFKKVGGDPKVPIKFLYLALKVTQPGAGSQQSLFRANDSHVVPHQPPELIPIVINDHDFIDILGVTGAPLTVITPGAVIQPGMRMRKAKAVGSDMRRFRRVESDAG